MSDFLQVLAISIILSLDALSVTIALSIKSKNHSLKEASLISILFGLFQGVMPLIGYFIGNSLKNNFNGISDWIAFILLSLVGAKMIYESLKSEREVDKKLTLTILIVLSLATSIDALVVGTTLALVSLPLLLSVLLIGITTFLICVVGYFAGKTLGNIFGKYVETAGGVALILLGIKFLVF